MELDSAIAQFAAFSALAIVCLLAVSAFFSGSETAFTGASRALMHQQARNGNLRARWVNTLMEQPERVIASILLGNNAVNILATAVATALFTRMLGEEIGVVTATLVMTALVVVFAEVVPKFFAIRYPDKIILRVSPVLRAYVALVWPISSLIPSASYNKSERGQAEKEAAIDEVRGLIEIHHRSGDVVKHERDMLRGILDLKDINISAVMIHRKNTAMLNVDQTPQALEKEIFNAEVARLPVFEGDPDNVIGVLNTRQARRVLREQGSKIDSADIKRLMQQPWFVPDTAALDKQLRAFLKQHSHFAVVVDEYGSIQGVVTLSDILEEVFGNIDEDETTAEEHTAAIVELDTGAIRCDGQTPVRDINRHKDWDIPYDEAATIGGLVIARAQNIPPVNYSIDVENYRIRVLARSHNRLTSVIVQEIDASSSGLHSR